MWANLSHCRATTGRYFPKIGTTPVGIVPVRPNLAEMGSNSAEMGPNSAELSQMCPRLGQLRHKSTQVCPKSTKLGQNYPKHRWDARRVGRNRVELRPMSPRNSAGVGPKFGQTRPETRRGRCVIRPKSPPTCWPTPPTGSAEDLVELAQKCRPNSATHSAEVALNFGRTRPELRPKAPIVRSISPQILDGAGHVGRKSPNSWPRIPVNSGRTR